MYTIPTFINLEINFRYYNSLGENLLEEDKRFATRLGN